MSSDESAYCVKIEGYRDFVLNCYLCETCYQNIQPSILQMQFSFIFSHFISLEPHRSELLCVNCLQSITVLTPLYQCPTCLRDIIDFLTFNMN